MHGFAGRSRAIWHFPDDVVRCLQWRDGTSEWRTCIDTVPEWRRAKRGSIPGIFPTSELCNNINVERCIWGNAQSLADQALACPNPKNQSRTIPRACGECSNPITAGISGNCAKINPASGSSGTSVNPREQWSMRYAERNDMLRYNRDRLNPFLGTAPLKSRLLPGRHPRGSLKANGSTRCISTGGCGR